MRNTNESSNKLLEDLCKLLQNCRLPINNSEDFRFYLLNCEDEQTTTKKSNTKSNEIFTLKTFILRTTGGDDKKTDSILKNIKNSKEKIINLYHKYNLEIPDKQKTENELLENLLYHYLAHEGTRFSPCYSRQRPTTQTVNKTIGRENDAEMLKAILEKERRVLIYGEFGSGKSHFIKYYLKKLKQTDFCYINYDYTLKSDDSITNMEITFHKIKYSTSDNITYYGSYHELKNEVFASSLLVIDSMYFIRDLGRVLEWLSTLAPQIIVITSPPAETKDFKGFFSYPLPCLSDESLLEIYEKASGAGKFPAFSTQDNTCLQEQLLRVSDRNVFMTSLIGKLCSKLSSPTSVTDYSLKKVLDYFESQDDRFKKDENIKIKYSHRHSGPKQSNSKKDNETLSIIGHIAKVYNLLLDNADKEGANHSRLHAYMEWLSCFGCSPLPLSFISCIFPDYKRSDLEELQLLGLVTLTDETVQLSPLISMVAFDKEPHTSFAAKKKEKNSSDEPKTPFDRLIHFLKSYENTLSVPYLSNSLCVFANSLYPTIPEKHNPNQQKTAQEFEKWQELLYLIQYYYNQNGDFEIAEKVISTIRYPKLKNAHNPIDQSFFECANNMRIPSLIEEMPKLLDNLTLLVIKEAVNSFNEANASSKENSKKSDKLILTKSNPNSIVFFETSLLHINAMDMIIEFYCRTSFELILNQDNSDKINKLQIYNCLLINSLQKLVGSFSSLPNLTDGFITNEKLTYYQKCSYLMSKDYPTLNDFKLCYFYFEKIKNTNIRIRMIALILFMQSLDYRLPDNNIYLSYCPLAIFQILMEKADFLRTQIQNCTFIPTQTFRLCLYAYIAMATFQRAIFSRHKSIEQCFLTKLDASYIIELINHSLLQKEEVETAIQLIDKYF